MSHFEHAIGDVLKHEGGFVDHPNDPGGATNWGVSLRWLKKQGDLDGDGWLDGDLDHDGDVDADDIRAMSVEQAQDFYRVRWWDPYHYDLINSQLIATKVFDLAINMGSKQAHKLLQRACRASGVMLTDDGVIGPKTLQTVNERMDMELLPALRSEAAGFYRGLVIKNSKYQDFINGWLKRAYS